MFAVVSSLLGGVGLFLLGMSLLGDGLKSLAGDSLRKALLLFTRKPVTAFFSGALATSLVQSSSATTLMTIGFVSAGLLPFSQSVGVLIGASLGTTSTGWIVSLLGLKLSISAYALVILAIGAACRLFLRGSASALGTALAGFGLVFLGIDLLKTGMEGLTQFVDLSRLPDQTFTAHLLVALVGASLTVVMQSSSAAMATTLTALYAEAINFDQAASLCIGAAIGTTVTAAIACIGAGIHARRTALAHILFNLSTGLLALFLMPVLLQVIFWCQRTFDVPPGAVSLALFHSLFILLGVALYLPFLSKFSAMVERMLPDRDPDFATYLDRSLLSLPSVALEALRRCLLECRKALAGQILLRLQGKPPETKQLDRVQNSLKEAREYLASIRVEEGDKLAEGRRIDDFHVMDHLQRLSVAVASRAVKPGTERLHDWEKQLTGLLAFAAPPQPGSTTTIPAPPPTASDLFEFSSKLAEWRRTERQTILREAAEPGADPEELLRGLESLQWLDQIAYHLWRIEFHLEPEREPSEPVDEFSETEAG